MTDPRVYAAPNPAEARAAAAEPPAVNDRALWLMVFAPPVVWAVDLLTSIALHHDYCAAATSRIFRPWSGVTVLLTVIGLAALVVAIVAGVRARAAHERLGSDTGRGDTDVDRRRFMARAGAFTSALFAYAIVLRLLAPLIVPAAFCGS